MKKCIFAGSFDPPTIGHKHVIQTSLKIFDEVVVAVMINSAKTPFLSTEERIRLLEKTFSGDKRVRVISFEGAAVDLLKRENTEFYVRGIRDGIDLEYENRDYFASKKLMPELIEIYIPCPQEDIHVSSTLVRNSVKFSKNYEDYIPQEILPDFLKITEKHDV